MQSSLLLYLKIWFRSLSWGIGNVFWVARMSDAKGSWKDNNFDRDDKRRSSLFYFILCGQRKLWTSRCLRDFFNSWLLEEWSFLGPCLFWEWSIPVMNEFYCIIESLKLWDVWRKSFSKSNDAKSCDSFRSFQNQLDPKRWLMACSLKSKVFFKQHRRVFKI